MITMANLKELNRLAADSLSTALTKLFNTPTEVKIHSVVKAAVPLPGFNLTSTITGIYIPITGDVKGASVITFVEETAFVLSDLLLKKKLGTTKNFGELEKSALSEVGNIITGNYLTVMSNILKVRIIEHRPEFAIEKFDILINRVASKFIPQFGMTLIIGLELIFEPATVNGYLLFFLEPGESTSKLENMFSIM